MSENTTPIISPLVNLIKYSGITPFGDQILLGKAPDLPSLHNQTKIFLKQLREIKGDYQPRPPPSLNNNTQRKLIGSENQPPRELSTPLQIW